MNIQKKLFHILDTGPDNAQQAPPPQTTTLLWRQFMPNMGTIILVVLLILTQNIWAKPLLTPTNAPGPAATTLNYQGRLADNNSAPLNGDYNLRFAIYDAATGGNTLWTEDHPAVPVSEGLFSLGLGTLTAGGIPPTVWQGDRYLEISIEGEALSPRELIRSVPLAGMALTVPDGAIATSKLADGSIATSKLADGAVTNQKVGLSYRVVFPGGQVSIPSDGNPTEITSLDVDFPIDGLYLIFAKVTTMSDAADQSIVSEIWDENGPLGGERIYNSHPVASWDGRQTGTLVTIRPFSAGKHTIKLKAFTKAGQTGSVMPNTLLYVIPFGQP